ncbi:MAG: ABC transporter ATP-binding protein [Desulfobulbaceae bacterium]|nr:ABC transporter ATP-binding protein [Desulfobulbaceae bacterium]
MLELRSLSIRAGKFLLEDVSLSAHHAQCHIIVGPTGSGKTLVLEAIIGFRKPDKGEILVDGRDITGLAIEERGISYVPQDLSIFPHLTVEENILYGVNLQKKKDGRRHVLAGELVEALGIGHLLKRSTMNLSGGELQRVALVRAIATGAKCLLLDEPLSSLHESLKKEIWFLLKELQTRYDLTILMVTHDLEEAFFLGDTISIFINGKVHQTGKKKTIYTTPETLDVAKFMGIRNLFTAEVVGSEKNVFKIHCPQLGRDLVIPKGVNNDAGRFEKGEKIIAGIRPEEAMILRSGDYRKNLDNIIEGTIANIFAKGASHTLFFMLDNGGQRIEVEIPDYALKKLQLLKGERRKISLRGENIFLLKI